MIQHASDSAADMPGGTRVAVEDAARLLGISENAVRKRIERGTLKSEKVDGVRYVLLDSNMSQQADDMSGHVVDMRSGMPGDSPALTAKMTDEIE